MKRKFWLMQVATVIVISAFVFTVASGQNTTSKSPQTSTDTIPAKKKPVKDIDDALIEIELSRAEVEKAMKEIDWEKIQKEIKEAMANVKVDMSKMQEELKQAMKEIDAAQIKASVDLAMKELKEIDTEKMKKEIEEAVAKIDFEKINKELEKVKEIDMSKVEAEMKKIKPEIEKSISEAKAGIEKAKKEITEYKNFIDGLEKDGLLDKKKDYTIEYKSGELEVNGHKVKSETQQKYKEFLKEKKDFTIRKSDNNFDINN